MVRIFDMLEYGARVHIVEELRRAFPAAHPALDEDHVLARVEGAELVAAQAVHKVRSHLVQHPHRGFQLLCPIMVPWLWYQTERK